jgi:hypothetical protein
MKNGGGGGAGVVGCCKGQHRATRLQQRAAPRARRRRHEGGAGSGSAAPAAPLMAPPQPVPTLMRHRKRSVTPRIYSLGCCRLLRRFWQIRIWLEGGRRGEEAGRGQHAGAPAPRLRQLLQPPPPPPPCPLPPLLLRPPRANHSRSRQPGQSRPAAPSRAALCRMGPSSRSLPAGAGVAGAGGARGGKRQALGARSRGSNAPARLEIAARRAPLLHPAHQVQQQQLLHGVILRRQHVAYDGDEQLRGFGEERCGLHFRPAVAPTARCPCLKAPGRAAPACPTPPPPAAAARRRAAS